MKLAAMILIALGIALMLAGIASAYIKQSTVQEIVEDLTQTEEPEETTEPEQPSTNETETEEEQEVPFYDFNGDGIFDWRDLDINEDGQIDIYDVAQVSSRIGTQKGDEDYWDRCDFNQDGKIDEVDLYLIKAFYGYPLSMFNVLLSVSTQSGQLFMLGLALTILGVVLYVVKGGKKLWR